jgi:glucose/mannose transport system permease protein
MREASRDKLKAFLTLLPSMILIGVFVYGFIGNTIWTSMTDWGGMGALALEPEKNFIGLENYIDLFTGFLGGGFRQDLVNAVYYSVLLLAGAVGLGMFIAILLDQKPRGEDVLRTIFLYPMSLSFIVSGTIWRWLLAPQGGVNVLPTYFGFEPLTFSWLSSQSATLVFNWQDLLRILIYIAAFVLILVGLFLLRKDQGRAIKRWLVPGILLGAFVWLFGGLHHGPVPGRVQRHLPGPARRGHARRRVPVRLLPVRGHPHAQADHHLGGHHPVPYLAQDVRPDLRHDRPGQRRDRPSGPDHVPDHLPGQ